MDNDKNNMEKKQTRPNPAENGKRKITSRQAAALAGAAVLVLLYLIMLAAAIWDSTAAAQWFRICLAATVAVPVLIWIYSWMYSRITGKPAIGDPCGQETEQEHASASDHPDSGRE